MILVFHWGFPGGASGKEGACQCRRRKRQGFHAWARNIPWRSARQPTPVFLPGESHGWRGLAGHSLWSRTESDTTEATKQACIPQHNVFKIYSLCAMSKDSAFSKVNSNPSYVYTSFSLCLCFCSIAKSWLTLCEPKGCNTAGLPVLHYLLEFAQTHVQWVGDAIQPSHPLSPPLLLPSIFPSIRVFVYLWCVCFLIH